MSQTLRLLAELIALPSVNPALSPSGDTQSGEQRVAEFLAAKAAKAGLDVEFQEVFPGRSNVIARLNPAGKVKHRILLAPHLDTVAAASPNQFVPKRVGGRLYGRGACDTKGSVAAMMGALITIAESGKRRAGTELIFAGLVDEEIGQGGSRALGKRMQADLAIVGEPTRLKIVTAHKGNLWLKLETTGKSAHGSRPDLGKNAVLEMARIVELIETTYAKELRRKKHPLLGSPTVNVGTIRGGVQANIVPAECAITVDRRTIPGETDRSVAREVKALLAEAGLHAKLGEAKDAPCLPMETDARLPLVQQFLQSARQGKPAGVNYFCDAAVLSAAGIPSVVFGPGDIAQAHTADEWIAVSELERAREMLVNFLTSLP